jgi:trehalose 6-phosphate phosphatase
MAKEKEIVDVGQSALFLDIDGTLAEIAPSPEAVVIRDDVVAALAVLEVRLQGRLAIVTGRKIADADRLLAPLRVAIAGVHGAEIRLLPDGEINDTVQAFDETLLQAMRAAVRGMVGVMVEPKGTAVAVHYRQAAAAGPDVFAVLTRLLAGDVRYAVTRGRMVCEVHARGVSKARAIERFLAEDRFRGFRPIMVGDDALDEQAFQVVRAHGGVGLRVAGEHFARATADFSGVADVAAWLINLASKTH